MTRGQLALACLLDLTLGDPERWPHPVRAFGWVIALADRARDPAASPRRQLVEGALLTIALVTGASLIGCGVERCAPLSVILAASTLAARSLDDAARAVQRALECDDIESARGALRALVGRDVERLDCTRIASAVLESLAESYCDGFVAPLLWLRAGGVGGGLAFKAISTLDSMIGHREYPHTWFGRVAARADDVANIVPARCAMVTLALAAALAAEHPRCAISVAVRDARRHSSPNAGWPEAALAGALHVRLGGDVSYDGVPASRTILGAEFAPPQASDIARGRRVVAIASVLTVALVLVWPR